MLTTLLQSLASRIGAFWTSVVRTVAPMFVGWVVAQLLELGIAIDKDDPLLPDVQRHWQRDAFPLHQFDGVQGQGNQQD